MLSLIVCSRDAQALAQLTRNVGETIGIPHEIIAVDNSHNRYGICEAYNVGAAQAQYNSLCFLHEDLRFHTTGWGSIVESILADQTIGVLGVAGGTHQLKAPSSWWFPGKEYHRIQVLHTLGKQEPILDLVNPTNQALADVAVLDGLWLCSRKEVWLKYPFDAATFTEFHFYDVDYCTTIFQQYRICVTFDILIEHFSTGSINKTWITNCEKYYTKWKSVLPFGVVTVDKRKEIKLEIDAIYDFIDLLIWYKMPLRSIYHWLKQVIQLGSVDRRVLGVLKQVVKHRVTR